ncbi:MAG: DUF2927 domain-containing protein [Rhodospirillaceae bacterium]|nr:DUF2927 domain-containing protein [Rhodospirillaceae bacterium]
MHYNTPMLALIKAFKANLLAVFLFATVFPASSASPDVDEISDYFMKIVFANEYEDISTKPKIISKWSGDIGVSVQGRATQQLAEITSKHLNYLSKVTGLKFKQIKPDDPMQSISIVFLKRQEMYAIKGAGIDPNVINKLASAGGCYFMAFHKPPQRIVKSIIAVNIERPIGLTDSCLLEELTQSLGLPNDSNMMRPSIFSDMDHETSLSRTDEILLRTLYDPRMTAGISPSEARTIAQTIISELNSSLP